MLRRITDLILAGVMIVLVLPLCIIIIIAIKIEEPGTLFFSGTRIGLNGKRFNIFKFRTMRSNVALSVQETEEFSHQFKLKDDPRVTRTGRCLRKYSLDEIPQLVNVFRGDMSVIGPRPKLPEEIDLYGDDKEELLSVPPGITGYWQTHRKNADSDELMRSMDMFYIRHRSISLDLKILISTPGTILLKKNY